MELREQIFVKICEASVGIGPEQLDAAKLADAILAIPEIRDALEALEEKRLNAMPGSAFGAMLLDNLPKR